jgi:pyruvate dehydrogenase E1 component alpha subunit
MTTGVSRDELVGLYEVMATITIGDERVRAAMNAGEFRVQYYPVRGLEAVCASLGLLLETSDYLVSTYRSFGDIVAKRVPLREIVAEILGRATGTSKGKGGSMHMAAPNLGLMATTGVVGSGIPIAAGLGLACSLRDDTQVTAVTFGDGATSIGAFHEGLNLAAVWSLPVVFICQNNGYAEGARLEEFTRTPVLAKKADAYGMRGVTVNGFDATATYQAIREAVDIARTRREPSLVECVTYRMFGHAFGSDSSYMPKAELERAWALDPTPAFRKQLLEQGVMTEGELGRLEARIKDQVEDAMQFARESPPPAIDELWTDVFADGTRLAQWA